MSERPILFSGPMVRAILTGAKTQTRRVVRLPGGEPWRLGHVDEDGACFSRANRTVMGREVVTESWEIPCPYGVPGERLWVREAFRQGDGSMSVHYRADPDEVSGGPWRPSIHMPRWASRLTLEITDVRVQRLTEISEADARAEGMEFHDGGGVGHSGWRHSREYGFVQETAVEAFRVAWRHINDKRAPWPSNPWVWAITFRRLA